MAPYSSGWGQSNCGACLKLGEKPRAKPRLSDPCSWRGAVACIVSCFLSAEWSWVYVYVYSAVVQLNSVIWQLSLHAKLLLHFSFWNLAASSVPLITAWKTESLHFPCGNSCLVWWRENASWNQMFLIAPCFRSFYCTLKIILNAWVSLMNR